MCDPTICEWSRKEVRCNVLSGVRKRVGKLQTAIALCCTDNEDIRFPSQKASVRSVVIRVEGGFCKLFAKASEVLNSVKLAVGSKGVKRIERVGSQAARRMMRVSVQSTVGQTATSFGIIIQQWNPQYGQCIARTLAFSQTTKQKSLCAYRIVQGRQQKRRLSFVASEPVVTHPQKLDGELPEISGERYVSLWASILVSVWFCSQVSGVEFSLQFQRKFQATTFLDPQ